MASVDHYQTYNVQLQIRLCSHRGNMKQNSLHDVDGKCLNVKKISWTLCLGVPFPMRPCRAVGRFFDKHWTILPIWSRMHFTFSQNKKVPWPSGALFPNLDLKKKRAPLLITYLFLPGINGKGTLTVNWSGWSTEFTSKVGNSRC